MELVKLSFCPYNAMESAQFHAWTALLHEKGMQWSFQ